MSSIISGITELRNTGSVVHSLRVQIAQLERQLEAEKKRRNEITRSMMCDAIRTLRLYGLISIYVGDLPISEVREQWIRNEPDLSDLIDQSWNLAHAPFGEDIKSAIRVAAINGIRGPQQNQIMNSERQVILNPENGDV